MAKQLPQFVSTSGGRILVTFGTQERRVLTEAGNEAIQLHKPGPVTIPAEGYIPSSEKEAEQLKAHPQYGKTFKALEGEEVEQLQQATAPEETPPSGDSEPSGSSPARQDEGSTGDRNYESVTSKAEAAEILTAEPFNIPVEALKSDAGNLTKENIRNVADQVGASFPNL